MCDDKYSWLTMSIIVTRPGDRPCWWNMYIEFPKLKTKKTRNSLTPYNSDKYIWCCDWTSQHMIPKYKFKLRWKYTWLGKCTTFDPELIDSYRKLHGTCRQKYYITLLWYIGVNHYTDIHFGEKDTEIIPSKGKRYVPSASIKYSPTNLHRSLGGWSKQSVLFVCWC